MSNNGDDCYFYYYSTCTKGDSCPFRHCEAAMGNETVCNLWEEGRCFRAVCKFRHMKIDKNRKEIPCYWENQVAGCQKPHCAFFHEKPRYIDGIFVPPDKCQTKGEEQPQEEPAPPPAAPLSAAPSASNPQLRGVIKTETQEPVPSPTHPPVVINPADDDEDEDEEGEDGRVGPSPRKSQKSGDSLNFGVSTLEEIRLRKALKASMKRAGYPLQSANSPMNGEKENIRSVLNPAFFEQRHDPLVFEETVRPRGSLAERLGRKVPSTEGVPLKKSLAERLGRVVDEDDPLMPPLKALKPIKERLGLSAGSVSPSYQAAETDREPKKAPEQILIKTLEQIRQEKAAKSQDKTDKPSVIPSEPNITKTITSKPNRSNRRAITIKDDCIGEVKTFSEVLRAKKKRQEEEEEQEQSTSPKKAKTTKEKAPERNQDPAGPAAADVGEVRVKTLEEIRREKAARLQAQQAMEAENTKSSDSDESEARKPRLLRVNKPAPQSNNNVTEKTSEMTEKQPKPRPAAPETNADSVNGVKVKTFEEIMREKRLRKQEMEEQAKKTAEAEPSQKQTPEETLKRKITGRVTVKPPGSSSPSSTSQSPDTTTFRQKLPVRKLTPLKPGAASPPKSMTVTNSTADTSATQSSPPPETVSSSQGPSSSKEVPDKGPKTLNTPSPIKRGRGAPRGAAAEVPAADNTLNGDKKTSPEPAADTRVKPKLNVKPSVVKPAAQVKPGQKRKGAARSAVAAVKPLNSASAVQEEPLHEKSSTDNQVPLSSSAEALQTSAVPDGIVPDAGCSSSSLTEELQTVPVVKQSRSIETRPTVSAVTVPAVMEPCTVPQSPVLKSPTQPKSRRSSTAAQRTGSTAAAAAPSSVSALDDFDELISEFTDDPMDGDVDMAIGEDDLLQELSEMIDS